MGIETVVFDAEGVIIDTEAIWDEGQRAFLGRHGIEYDREAVKPLLTGRSLEDGTAVLIDLYGLEGEPSALARERADIVRELMEQTAFIPGFRDFFESVRDEYRTCVATAMAEDLFAIVDARLGIRRLFEGRVYTLSEVENRSKPDPALFLLAAAKLETPAERCVVIEDSPHGITAARRAGMHVVGLATTYRPDALAAADVVVSSFEELGASGLRQIFVPEDV